MRRLFSSKAFKSASILLIAAIAGYFWRTQGGSIPVALDNSRSAAAIVSNASTDTVLTLITEPTDGTKAIETAITGAHSSVDLVIYELSDKTIEADLIAAEARGVAVRVLLNKKAAFNKEKNQAAYDVLAAGHVPVEWTSADFVFTHQKTLIVDKKRAIVMTFNLTPQYYATGRDFGIIDDDADDVAAIESVFGADWSGKSIETPYGHSLVWSPKAAPALIALIDSAKTSLLIYNEEMADPRIIAAIEAAAKRGVTVHVVMTYSTSWKSAFNELAVHGVGIKTYASTAKTYIHAKMILADDREAFLGSENFSETSLDRNRELGIMIAKPDIVASLEKTFASDWANARPYAVKK